MNSFSAKWQDILTRAEESRKQKLQEIQEGKVLKVSPGLHHHLTPQKMAKIVGSRGSVDFFGQSIDHSVHYIFTIKTDDPNSLREYLISQGVHSDGSYGTGYW